MQFFPISRLHFISELRDRKTTIFVCWKKVKNTQDDEDDNRLVKREKTMMRLLRLGFVPQMKIAKK